MRKAVWPALLVMLVGMPACVFDKTGYVPTQTNNNNDNGNNNNNNQLHQCGDGLIAADEECDDGNTAAGDGCGVDCVVEHGYDCTGIPSQCHAVCGDGVIAAGVEAEGCDDGNTSPGDGCGADCVMEAGWVCGGEPSDCEQSCGDGVLDPGEACDDGNLAAGDGCTASCAVEHGYDCTGAPSVCQPTCGDGVVAGGTGAEACDDGNTVAGDGCSSSCLVEEGFTCAGDPSLCTPLCGDGLVVYGEACDDGNSASGDGCSDSCLVESGWSCVGEPSSCTTECGDGIVAGAEQCDDGNQTGADGCDSACLVEHGYGCTGSPSVCHAVCGDGVLALGMEAEACDDGNQAAGDGCSATCTVEDFYACDGAPSICVCVVFVRTVPLGPFNDGRSWINATASPQVGIDTAASLGSGCEVWVAGATYHIHQGAAADTVSLASGVAVYGGFTGSETARAQRDPDANVTVLDGESGSASGEHVYHVVTANNVTGAELDGFTITQGVANGGSGGQQRGGGLVNLLSATVVRDCVFSSNFASGAGGAIYNDANTLELIDSIVELNGADDGAGLYNDGGSPTITRCVFFGNVASSRGGGMYNDTASPTVVSCVFVVNDGGSRGGGIQNWPNASPTIRNCLFVGNTADQGGGIRSRNNSNAVIVNSIFWANSVGQLSDAVSSSNSVTYSDVQGGYGGTGNIDQDPQFVNATGGDFRLTAASPCIDAANGDQCPATDYLGVPPWDDPAHSPDTGVGTPTYCDMGPLEYHP